MAWGRPRVGVSRLIFISFTSIHERIVSKRNKGNQKAPQAYFSQLKETRVGTGIRSHRQKVRSLSNPNMTVVILVDHEYQSGFPAIPSKSHDLVLSSLEMTPACSWRWMVWNGRKMFHHFFFS
jgi:hypothetical protein